MAYPKGALPASALKTIEPGQQLAIGAANAYARAKAAFKAKKKVLGTPRGYAAYRSAAVQNHMSDVGDHGTAAQRSALNLNPHSSVRIARHPNGTHEDGYSVDLLVNGRFPDASDRALLAKYGFTRPFGDRDPNHFHQDGKTAIGSLVVTKAPTKPTAAPKTIKIVDGDTLGAIAKAYKTTVPKIMALNKGKIKNANAIYVGQKVRVR